jgi:hypothetical protein
MLVKTRASSFINLELVVVSTPRENQIFIGQIRFESALSTKSCYIGLYKGKN